MTSIKSCVSGLIGAALLTTVASGAHAAICGGSSGTGCGSGELFLNVWNPTAATSYSLDLGVTADQFANDTVSTQTWDLSNSAVAPLFGAFANALATGTVLTYNIAANNTNGGLASPNWGVLSTFDNTPAEVDGAQDGTNIILINGTMSNRVLSRIDNLNASARDDHGGASVSDFGADLDEASIAGEFSYFDDEGWGVDLGGTSPGLATATNVGDGLDFYLMGRAGPTGLASRFVLLGKFNFTTAGLLTYTSVSAVPLPASAWLFGAALLGSARCRRRHSLAV